MSKKFQWFSITFLALRGPLFDDCIDSSSAGERDGFRNSRIKSRPDHRRSRRRPYGRSVMRTRSFDPGILYNKSDPSGKKTGDGLFRNFYWDWRALSATASRYYSTGYPHLSEKIVTHGLLKTFSSSNPLHWMTTSNTTYKNKIIGIVCIGFVYVPSYDILHKNF